MSDSVYVTLLLTGAALIGSSLMWVGLRVVAFRRPFVIRGYWLTGFVLLGVTSVGGPGVVASVFSFRDVSGPSALMLAWSSLMIAMAVLAVARFSGLLAFGMKGKDVRDALFAALRELKVEFTESLSAVELTESHARIDVTTEGWMGIAQLRSPDPTGRRFLPSIARGMNRYYRATPVSLAWVSPLSYMAFGGMLLGLVSYYLLAA